MLKKEKFLYLIIFSCLFSIKALSNPFIRLDSISLANTKQMINNGTASEETLDAYKKLIKNADKLLNIKNPTVLDKTINPPTGNKHDYLSISRYWWPNPETENGLPWVRHDGKTNPDTQTDAVDRQRLGLFGKSVWNLSLAYYFTNNEIYAEKAISMIETWFLNEETFMNPNLNYAQSVPGNPNKRATGILDGRSLVMFVPDAINLLSISKNWQQKHTIGTTQWFTDYLNWLTKSDVGIKGSLQENNHGSWYKFQVAGLALYLDNKPLAKTTIELAEKSLDKMLNNEGGQIHELARTRTFFYSCFNLQALSNIAVLADKLEMNMWQYETDTKKSLFLALNYLTPVVKGEKWKHDTLKSIDVTGLIPIILLIPNKYNTLEYKNVLAEILNSVKENNQSSKNDFSQEFWLFNSIN